MDSIHIIIPAYNEAERIERTLHAYHSFFSRVRQDHNVSFTLLVVLNGCIDATPEIVKGVQEHYRDSAIVSMSVTKPGKGLAIKHGFLNALNADSSHIGFVDADMATRPEYFFELYTHLSDCDGMIASRYMAESKIDAPRPWIKEWGRKLIYNNLVHALFDIKYADTQCGAKLFKRSLIETVIDHMSEGQWAFDIELLYLAKKHGFIVAERPTVWFDQEGSKFNTFGAGLKMLKSLFELARHHNVKH